ncbi:MAG: methylenetetrahydrofolate--tRNA-(uracil(54)-C(5))-methyltransferase (FADH(2)-oxidizing) TrmFO [Deltaproteobacteria bacterium]|nr:methylenetetrahydrofolate--tRNA-(uracil(54)-C(5))-methyltransferase (FADH(2)-oxidizing) TrmFO [Deltaproteobacteria bacterium]
MVKKVKIIGGGLAGSEAAWQLISRGYNVEIYEMRPHQYTKAHHTQYFAELVCSNSLRGNEITQAAGLLKEELRQLDSLIMMAAEATRVPAGGALAVDRELFSKFIDEKLRSHPLVSVITEEVSAIVLDEHITIVAAGPLCSQTLASSIQSMFGMEHLHFFDAISPIINADSINMSKVFRQSRYDKNGDDYLNIPLTKDEYASFIELLRVAEKFGGHDEIEADCVAGLKPFEGCMPIESMLERGDDTLRFGPMKPVGLIDPTTNQRPYAVVQLRQDDKDAKLWSMVGFQTKLRHGEQLKIFRQLPGLEAAEFVRLGSVHRNTFINSPQILKPTNECKQYPGLYFAGQLTGVEGYVESTASGLVAGINAALKLAEREQVSFPLDTAVGSLLGYISDPNRKDFQPMNVNFGLFTNYMSAELPVKKKGKAGKREHTAQQALFSLNNFKRKFLN